MDIDVNTKYGRLKARMPDPQGSMRLPEFVFNLFPLEERLVSLGVASAQKEGRSVSCRAGCGACCRQPVPISAPEAFLLYEMMAGLPPERRDLYLGRFIDAKDKLREHGFSDRSLEGEAAAGKELILMAADYFGLQIPCPFLIDESCSIHPSRPMSCREHLVTSPAELCRSLIHPDIRGIHAPVSLTQVLAQLYAELEGTQPTLLPMPLALDFAVEQRAARIKQYEAKPLFDRFLVQLKLMAEPDEK